MCAVDAVDAVDAADAGENVVKSVPKLLNSQISNSRYGDVLSFMHSCRTVYYILRRTATMHG